MRLEDLLAKDPPEDDPDIPEFDDDDEFDDRTDDPDFWEDEEDDWLE